MKKLYFLCFILFSSLFSVKAQDAVYNIPGKEMPENIPAVMAFVDTIEVVAVNGISADDLFSRGKIFIAHAFKSSNDVRQLADQNTHTIIAKGGFSIPYGFDPFVFFTMEIQTKSGRYRYVIKDLIYHWNLGVDRRNMIFPLADGRPKGYSKKKWQKVMNACMTNIDDLIISLKKTMNQSGETPSDW